MISPWLSYVPRHVADDILRNPGESPIGREQRFDVVALFADVSGFTAMSEALAQFGRAGTEDLTTILNSYFRPMIELIESYGGVVGKFGGDAVTVLFPYTVASQMTASGRAVQCALEMQANMQRYEAIQTRAGAFSLAMKAGLAMGPVLCTSVGDPAIRLEYIIAGQVLDLCADAEHHATKGEVVIHNGLLKHVPDVNMVEERGNFSKVSQVLHPVEKEPLAQVEETIPSGLATFAAYLHPAIAQRISAGQTGFIDEHRRVTVLFVRFDGFDYDTDPEVCCKLQHYLASVIQIVHRYDGYLNKVDMGDKGSKYIVLFGTPVAHENDEERAVRCALELAALPDSSVRIGVNSGVVYCGQVGSDARREYTVIGDPVNLAARLMQAAKPREILVSSSTQRHVSDVFTWEYLAPIMVKGKAEPVPLYVVTGYVGRGSVHLQEPSYRLPMVGRQRELERVAALIDDTLAGQGHLLGVTGEAGLGKSRFNAEIIKLAMEMGLVAYGGACQSYGTNISYLVWQTIWQGFFDIDPAAPLESQSSRLQTQLADIDIGLIQRMPLLGPALGISLPDNDLTRTLDPQLRTELLRALLLRCLRYRARSTPMLLVLEDAHWIDALSGDLLEFIARNLVDLPILLVGLYRPHEARYGVIQRLSQLAHAQEIRLEEFSLEEARQLIVMKLNQNWGTSDGVPPLLAERISTKAQGNPFFIEEMVNYIRDRGIDPRDTAAIEALDLPDSLQSLIISRIDQLHEGEKTTLKVASVIGRVFKAAWLWGSYPEVGTSEQVMQHLEALSQLDLTPLDKPEPELEYIFKHITTQEVAYDSLTFGLREILHENVGQFVERAYDTGLDRQLDVLAFHYGRSRNTGKQRVYFRRAGDAAKATYANQAAIDYYHRLLPLAPDSEQSDIMRELAEVLQLIGKWPEAETMYHDALARAQPASLQRAECECALGNLLSYTKSYEESISWLVRAKEAFQDLGSQAGVGRALKWLSFVYWQQGSFAESLACSEQYLRLASELGDEVGVSEALSKIGMVYWRQSRLADALEYLRRALDVAGAIGYQRGLIHSAINIAGVYWQLEDYPRALEYLQQSLATATLIGHLVATAQSVGNAGTLYGQQGQSSYALKCYQRALSISIELGDQSYSVIYIGNIAAELTVQRRFSEAERVYAHAIALGQRTQSPYLLCGHLYHQAELLHQFERNSEAALINQEGIQVADGVGRKEIQFQARVLAIRLRVALNQMDKATAIGELRDLANDWTESSEQAAIGYAIWRLDESREVERKAAAELYRSLYKQSPNIEYRERYFEVTGTLLPEPSPLPPLPESVIGEPEDLKVLLARVGLELS